MRTLSCNLQNFGLTYVYVVDPGAELWPDKIVGLRQAGIRRGFLDICQLGGLLNYSPWAWKTTNKNCRNYFQPLDFLQSHKGASCEESLERVHGVREYEPCMSSGLDPDGARYQ